ncbi:MAG TPA: PAS domain S-box protein [Nitrospiria bacterium]|nr:PAS domain S-box protein [Nitrospiria bacterium]
MLPVERRRTQRRSSDREHDHATLLRQTTDALRETDQRFRIMADTAPVMIWMSGQDKRCNFFNKGWLDFTGRAMEQELGDGWAEGVHPDDLRGCVTAYETAFDAREEFKIEYRLRRADGEYRWLLDHGTPRYLPGGGFVGYIGACIDITDRKRAEEALARSESALRVSQSDLQSLAGKLLAAQEEERRVLARELHDDLSQRLAAAAIEVGVLEGEPYPMSAPVLNQLVEIKQQLVALSTEVHDLSRRLHPSIIDDLGLVDAIRSECDRFSAREGVSVECFATRLSRPVSKDVALGLYRITQEALRNIAKHARADRTHVTLGAHGLDLLLSIRDDGEGFDPEGAKGRGGLGLASMRERVQLLRGELAIVSSPGAGTTIEVRVPFRSSHDDPAIADRGEGV